MVNYSEGTQADTGGMQIFALDNLLIPIGINQFYLGDCRRQVLILSTGAMSTGACRTYHCDVWE